MTNKLPVYFLILMLTAYPASAGEVSLNRWVLNITLNENGIVDMNIQAELQNSDTSLLDGISLVVPASKVTMIYDFSHTFSSAGQTAELESVQGGTRINLNFNQSIKSGDKWDGRIGFTAENMAVKEGSSFTLNMPVDAPQAIVSGKKMTISVTPDADIRAQVFLPKSYEITTVQPEPFRKLFQYGRMVPTWTPEKLHIGDTIKIKTSYSDVLAKIVDNDDRARIFKDSIKKAKDAGKDVSEAELHFANANENNNKAYAAFGGKDYTTALQYAGYANDELIKTENSLAGDAKAAPQETKKNPGFEMLLSVTVLLMIFLLRKKGPS